MEIRNWRIRWIPLKLVMALCLVTVSLAFSVPRRSLAAETGIKIMPLGDSITYGIDGRTPTYTGPTNDGGYRLPLWNALAAEGANIHYVGSQQSGPSSFDQENEGHPGWCIDQIAANIGGWLNTYQPQIILLHIGTNDILHNADPTCAPNDPADVSTRLSNLIGQITVTAPNATLIVSQILPLNSSANSQVITYNAAIPGIVQSKVAQGKHVQYVDMYDAVPTTLLADGVHPSDSGYGLMANVWNDALLPLLPINSGSHLLPPLGWNSWNHFGCNVSESLIKQTADAMVSNGMKAVGYQYVNIDDCWQGSRASNGAIIADQTRFPDGIKALADYVHNDGLKLGIYTGAGTLTCQGYPGSFNYEQQDATTYASWGIDYVKEDWCNTAGLDPQTQYTIMRDAFANTGRSILLSICNWGVNSPWVWGPGAGNLWRTTPDISDTWTSMLANLDASSQHAASAGPGGWNDPDILEVGNGGMTATEDQSQFSLWAIMAAPLIASNDITTMSAVAQATLTNTEVIAVDQDPAGVQGTKVSDNGSGLQVWSKKLQGSGQRAVMLFNRSASSANITVNWSDVGLTSGNASVRDLVTHTDHGLFNGSYTANVPSHGVVMLKIVGTAGSTTSYEAEASANTIASGASVETCTTCSGGQKVGFIGNGGTLQFNSVNVNTEGNYRVTIYYGDGDAGRSAMMAIDGGSTLTLKFPGTDDGNYSNIQVLSVMVNLNAGNNSIFFSNPSGWTPDFDRITVSRSAIFLANASYHGIIRSTSKVFDVYQALTTDNSPLIQFYWKGGANQLWSIISLGGGYYAIINRNSDKGLAVFNNSTADNAAVNQYHYDGSANQQWSLVSTNGSYYKIINRNSGEELAVQNASTADGTAIVQFSDNEGTNQQFSFAQL